MNGTAESPSDDQAARADRGERDVSSNPTASRIVEALVVVGAYSLAVALFMGPLLTDPLHRVYAPADPGQRADQNLILWILAWDWHALTTAPLSLFDAPIHHPALRTLAGSEHMLGIVPLSGPIYAISGNPLLACTLAHMLTLSLSGASMYALLRHWGVMRAGSAFGGFVFALHPGQIHGGPELQLLSFQYLPLSLIFLDSTLRNARVRSAFALAALLLWQMLCSVYLAFIAAISLTAYAATMLICERHRVSARGAALVAAAVVAAAVVLVPIHMPYLELRSAGVIREYTGTDMILEYSSGPWRNWLLPPIAKRLWGWHTGTGIPSYLGLLPMLAAACIPVRRRSEAAPWAVPACLAIALTSYVIALGPSGSVFGHTFELPYAALAERVPGFASMRVPSRFSVGVMMGFSALAGIGVGRLLAPLQGRTHGNAWIAGTLALLLCGTAVEYDLPFDKPTSRPRAAGDRIPRVYATLASLPEGPVLELPAHGATIWNDALLDSGYMYFGTFHWRPLLNGYSGYEPPAAKMTLSLSRALPDADALAILVRSTGLRYVIAHLEEMPGPVRAKWTSAPAGLRLLERIENDLLFEVSEPVEPDLLVGMRDGPPSGRTLLGARIDPIPESARRGDIRFTIPPPAEPAPSARALVEIEVRNTSDALWPALAPGSAELVEVDHRLIRLGESAGDVPEPFQRPPGPLPYDLLPGEHVRMEFWVAMPREPGWYELEVGLKQNGRWFDGASRAFRFRVLDPGSS